MSDVPLAFPGTFAPGIRIGRYHIHDRIARGGMGEVWLATAYGVGGFAKKVVIKTIIPALARDRAYIDMLVNEASLVARLNHPNIVQVFDLECVDGAYFIAMEYLPGRALSQVLQHLARLKERIPVWLAARAVAVACDGLQYAHDFADDDGRPLGLLHRDLSPSNIMLTFAGNVTILDFGIAKATKASGNSGAVLKGKYHYLAPERILGRPCDRRSDVYSMGVVLYQLLTGRRPFHADNDAALLDRVVKGSPPPPRHYAPDLGRDLEACVLRALATQPAERYQHASDLAADIRGCLRARGELREVSDVAAFMRRVFSGAPELSQAWLEESVDGTDDEIPIDEDLVIEEWGESLECRAVERAVSAPWPLGSEQATDLGREQPSVYDLARSVQEGGRVSEVPDFFAPPARRRLETDRDVFAGAARSSRGEAEEAEDEPPFIEKGGDGDAGSWPWASGKEDR